MSHPGCHPAALATVPVPQWRAPMSCASRSPAARAMRAIRCERAADGNIQVGSPTGASEEVSFFLNEVAALFFYVGVVPRGQDLDKAAPNHSPNVLIDEKALVVGVRRRAAVPVNFLAGAETD